MPSSREPHIRNRSRKTAEVEELAHLAGHAGEHDLPVGLQPHASRREDPEARAADVLELLQSSISRRRLGAANASDSRSPSVGAVTLSLRPLTATIVTTPSLPILVDLHAVLPRALPCGFLYPVTGSRSTARCAYWVPASGRALHRSAGVVAENGRRLKKPPSIAYAVERARRLPYGAERAAARRNDRHRSGVPLVLGREGGLSAGQTSDVLAATMLILGLGAVLQSLARGALGAGYLCPKVCTA